MGPSGGARGAGGRAGLWVGPPDDPDRYRLGPAVAAGSEGVVYRAQLVDGDREVAVAIKMLHPGHHRSFDRWAARWEEQAELLRHVAAPGLVPVRDTFAGPLPHGAGAVDPTTRSLYLVMDWVEGEPLWEWAQRQPEASAEALLVPLVSVAAALDLLHEGAATGGRPLVHGDVKPGNVLVTPGGATVLVDLGTARVVEPERGTGVVGTEGYVAPEVLRGGGWTPAADRYALGAVACALLTGEEPPRQPQPGELRGRLEACPRAAGRPELVDHLMQMLDDDPDARPTGLANWIAQLRRSSLVITPGDARLAPLAPGRRGTEGSPPPGRVRRRARRRVLAGGAALTVAALVTGAVVWWPTEDPIEPIDMRAVDWSTIPMDVCGEEDVRIDVNDTEPTRFGWVGDVGSWQEIRTVPLVGEVDGEPGDETVHVLHCTGYEPGVEASELQVWTSGPDGPELLGVTRSGECPEGSGRVRCFDGPWEFETYGVEPRLADGRLELVFLQAEPDDPECCPSTVAPVALRWIDGALRVADARLRDLSGPDGPRWDWFPRAWVRAVLWGFDTSGFGDSTAVRVLRDSGFTNPDQLEWGEAHEVEPNHHAVHVTDPGIDVTLEIHYFWSSPGVMYILEQ